MTTENSQPTLAELILTKKGQRTYAKLSADCGGAPTDSRLNSLVLRSVKTFPDSDTIRGLAIGLNVPVADVILASARSLGLVVGVTEPGTLSLPGAAHLPASAQAAIVEVARELMKIQQTAGAKKSYTEYQSEIRQDFAHQARLRRVPAVEIEEALQGPGWYMIDADTAPADAVDAALGWVKGDNGRQIRAALSDALAGGTQVAQDDVELAADRGENSISPDEVEHHA